MFALFVWMSWLLPRKTGITGMLLAQLLTAAGFLELWYIGYATQPDATYGGGLEVISPLVYAFAFNCLMLPIVGVALWLQGRDERVRASKTSKPRWYVNFRTAIVAVAFAYFVLMLLKWFGVLAEHTIEFASPIVVVGLLFILAGVLESALKSVIGNSGDDGPDSFHKPSAPPEFSRGPDQVMDRRVATQKPGRAGG